MVLGSVVYWGAWLGLTTVAATLHGDCGAGTTQAELASCVTEKKWLFWSFVAVGSALWVAAIFGLVNEHRRSGYGRRPH